MLLRVITVSLETIKIVASLPKLDILDLDDVEAVAANVVPFRKVDPKPEEYFETCVPLVALQAAAGKWSDVQESIPELEDPAMEWIAWDTSVRYTKDMFVAQVCGRSMEPSIPDGS